VYELLSIVLAGGSGGDDVAGKNRAEIRHPAKLRRPLSDDRVQCGGHVSEHDMIEEVG